MTTQSKKFGLGQLVISCIGTLVVFPAVVLGLSGDWLWPEGWIFGLWFAAMVLFSQVYLYWRDPALLAERAQLPGSQNQKTWDKYLLTAVYFIAILWLVIMPLDAKRFGWSPAFPLWLKVVGGVLLIPALYLIERTTIENTFLSSLVRIQTERKQRVISTGVYSFVRHPLYLGCLLMMLGAPLLLGSLYGLILSLIGFILVAGRIVGEEKMLVNELEGYEDYKEKVKYRLVPFVW